MRKILLPVDFSKVSTNAIEYALEYSDVTDQIVILHVTMGMGAMDLQAPVLHDTVKEEVLSKSLYDYIIENSKYNVLPDRCQIRIKLGIPVETIVREAEAGGYDYIIMGTRDKYDLLEKWFGTISLGVVKRVRMPVLLVPIHSKYTKLKKILIASDHHLMDNALLDRIRIWNQKRKAFIRFLHIKTEADDSYEEGHNSIIQSFFAENEIPFGFEVVAQDAEDISDSLLSNAYQFNADMLVVFPDEQSYLQSLLFKSISKEMVLKSSIPVYFIHPTKAETS